MLDAAIVGLGWWGRNIVEAVHGKSERIRFVHAVTKEPDVARDLVNAKGIARLSTDLEAAIADPRVQAIALATPHSLHTEQIIAIANAGKPVFCEKPLALKRADAERAVAACRKAGVVLGVGQNKHFWPAMVELKKVVQSGVLGEVLHVESHYSNENSSNFFAPWRDLASETPGAGMTGTGIHLLEAFTSMFGAVSEVSAQFVARRGGHDPRDSISVLFKFANGMSGFLGAVRPSPVYWRVHVFGDKGSAEALGETELVLRTNAGKVERFKYPAIDSLRAEFDAFADAVAGNAPYPISMDEMVQTIATFDAIIRSIDSGNSERP
jgi:predicted dehydrogenase